MDTVLSDEQEWNNFYNPKKLSLEAINKIIINRRGKGPAKKVYSDMYSIESGPYYDPKNYHIHIWKKHNLIKDFKGEQFQNVEHIQYTDFAPGTYCSICHQKNKKNTFNFFDYDDFSDVKHDICKQDSYYSISHLCEQDDENVIKYNSSYIDKWLKLYERLLYTSRNKKTLYNISKVKSLLLWPWEMTNYQVFNYNYPNYRDNSIFVKSDISEFKK